MERFSETYLGHFVSDEWSGPRMSNIPSEEYGRVVKDNIVVSCSDVVLERPDGQIFLVRRRIQPLKGEYWLIGGRQNPGEVWVETAARHLKRDTGLDFPFSRFIMIGVYATVFAIRHELPQENGCHTNNFTFVVQVKDNELVHIKLNPREYAKNHPNQWFAIEDIEEMTLKGLIHPCIHRITLAMKKIMEVK